MRTIRPALARCFVKDGQACVVLEKGAHVDPLHRSYLMNQNPEGDLRSLLLVLGSMYSLHSAKYVNLHFCELLILVYQLKYIISINIIRTLTNLLLELYVSSFIIIYLPIYLISTMYQSVFL